MAGCLEAARLLQAYLDGQVDERATERVAAHLHVCRRCGLEADTYRALKNSIGRHRRPLPEDRLRRLTAFAAELSGSAPPPP